MEVINVRYIQTSQSPAPGTLSQYVKVSIGQSSQICGRVLHVFPQHATPIFNITLLFGTHILIFTKRYDQNLALNLLKILNSHLDSSMFLAEKQLQLTPLNTQAQLNCRQK